MCLLDNSVREINVKTDISSKTEAEENQKKPYTVGSLTCLHFRYKKKGSTMSVYVAIKLSDIL